MAPDTEVLVNSPSGRVLGRWTSAPSVAAFRGIPYAQPPVGDRRWRPAQLGVSWEGTRPAVVPGAAPLQSQPPRDSLLFQANYADRQALVMSEDCLFLEVWTPDPGRADLPVMVWVPGGGNRFGSGSLDLFDGRELASRGVVVVSVTHRLGALGFMSHPELRKESADGSSGNYALTDIIAALTWVQDNIAAFGGDPGNVTAFGSSAGAGSLCHLMASPRVTGLFHRVIGQSLSGFERPGERIASQDVADAAGMRLGAGRDLRTLRNQAGVSMVQPGDWGPIIEPGVLPTRTAQVFGAGHQAKIPLLVGHNADEGSVYVRADSTPPDVEAVGADLLALYPPDDATSARRYVGDSMVAWRVWKWATTHMRTSGAPVWTYRFGQAPPVPDDRGIAGPADGLSSFGAFHTAELPYVWNSLGARDWAWSPEDRHLAGVICSAWTDFATRGAPGTTDGCAWPRMQDGVTGPVLEFGTPCRVTDVASADQMHGLDRWAESFTPVMDITGSCG